MPRGTLRTRLIAAGSNKDSLPPLPPKASSRRVSGRGGVKRKSEEAFEDDNQSLNDADKRKERVKYEGMLEEFDLEGTSQPRPSPP
jgi:hypothetical protein